MIYQPQPLLVQVGTKDGRVRNVVLTKGIAEKHFQHIDNEVAYYFGWYHRVPEALIGQGIFGMTEEPGDTITHIERVTPIKVKEDKS